jgi:hypothetical protein
VEEEEEQPEENKASNEVELMGKVQITEPRKEVEQQSTFVSYLVISKVHTHTHTKKK